MRLRTLLALALITQAAVTAVSTVLCLALAGWPDRAAPARGTRRARPP